jgi:hypothetical protein
MMDANRPFWKADLMPDGGWWVENEKKGCFGDPNEVELHLMLTWIERIHTEPDLM